MVDLKAARGNLKKDLGSIILLLYMHLIPAWNRDQPGTRCLIGEKSDIAFVALIEFCGKATKPHESPKIQITGTRGSKVGVQPLIFSVTDLITR